MNVEDHPVRTCARCGRPEARVVGVVRHLYGGNPVGETYDHTCFGCGAKFKTQSARRLLGELSPWVFITLLALAIGGFGVFSVFDTVRSIGGTYFSFRLGMIITPLLAFGLGGWATRFAFGGLKDAFAPARADMKNPVAPVSR
jgi:hypothetical protein